MTSSPHLPDFFLPSGFQFTAVTAGLKPSGKPDFAIAVADEGASAAAMVVLALVLRWMLPARVPSARLSYGRLLGGGCLPKTTGCNIQESS